MKKGVIFLLVLFLYAQNDIYSYIVYKTKYVEIQKLFKKFLSDKELKPKYFKPLIVKNITSPIRLTGSLEGYTDKILAQNSYKYDGSLDLGFEVDINKLLSVNNQKQNIYHNYENESNIAQKLNIIYENNVEAINYKKNRFIKSISDVFEFYSQYEPQYKTLYEKYHSLKYIPATNREITAYKPNHLNPKKLKEYLDDKKRAFVFKITNINSPTILKKIKMKLKLTYTNDFGNSSRDYISMGVNFSIPLTKETDNITLLKNQLIYSYNLLTSKILNLNLKMNQTYYQFYNTTNSIRLKLGDIKYDLIKIKNGIFVDYDNLTSKYLGVFYQIDSLNNQLNQNLNYSAQLYSLLKDLNEY